mgnify:CR=1 FL=1
MSSWEFVLLFWAILLGAGVTNLIHGVGTSILHRDRVRFSFLHLSWLIILLFLYVSAWFNLFGEQDQVFEFVDYLSGFLHLICLSLLTVISFPSFGGTNPLDLREHFFHIRRPYFLIWSLFWLPGIFAALTAQEGAGGLLANLDVFVYFGASCAGFSSANAKLHAWLPAIVVFGGMVPQFF